MIKLKVLDQDWKVYLFEDDKYCRLLGQDSAGLTNPRDKELYFNLDDITPIVVRHELCHAFYASSGVDSVNFTLDQQEEFMCDMFAIHGDRILRLSRRLYKELKDGDID